MPETTALSEPQRKAIALLLGGKSQGETAKELDVSRKTVNRWNASADFQAEMARQKTLGDRAQINLSLREAAIAQIPPEKDEWIEELDNHIDWLKKACTSIKSTGINSVIKAARRLRDLPDEALKPADAIALYKLGMDAIAVGRELEAELLGIRELAERMTDGQQD